MTVLLIPACLSAAEYKSTMRDSTVVRLQFFLTDKMYCCIIIGEIVRHGLDLFFNLCSICSLFQYYETLSCMLLSCCKFRIFSISYCLKSRLYRDRILLSIFYTFYSADCIRMSLADTFAPERISASLYQNRLCIQTVQ